MDNTASTQNTLPQAVSASRKTFTGKTSYYADDSASGRPLLLLHSINAAASVFEVKPLFEYYQSRRPVYAPDLPGYGFSDRSDRAYLPGLYVNTIITLLDEVIGQAADVVALSLTSEFVARAALKRPDLFHSITMISPTGMSNKRVDNIPQKTLHSIFSFPLWSQVFYDLLVRRSTIAYYLEKSLVNDVPQSMIDYAYSTAHQSGARYAPLYFISAQMFTSFAIDTLYQKLAVPTCVIYDRDPNVTFEGLPALLETNKHIQAKRITPSLGLPHWEKLDETAATLEEFWGSGKADAE